MATVTITITASTQTYGRTPTLSGADLTRLLNAYRVSLGQVPDGAGGFRDRTDAEVIQGWADKLILETKKTVRNYERSVAINNAVSNITDITLTS